MTKHPKHLAVLNAVAEKIGWGKPRRKAIFLGLSQHDGVRQLRGRRRRNFGGRRQDQDPPLVGATDPGYAVNPAQIDRQVAGSFVYGLSALFYGESPSRTARSSRPTSTPTTRCASRRCRRWSRSSCRAATTPWGGVGEPTILVAAPAVLNAYFRATGKRIRSFPLKNHNLQIA